MVAALVAAALYDLKERRIPNTISLIVIGLFVVLVAVQTLAGTGIMTAFIGPLAAAAVVFLIGLGLFALGLMGGGDVKLMATATLLAGTALSLPFVLYTTLAGGLVALLTLCHAKWAGRQASGAKVPYGVAISFGGFWVCFERVYALYA